MSKVSDNEAFVKKVQAWLGVTVDGHAGVRTNLAWDEKTQTQSPVPGGALTEKIALELISHEAIVQEAYKDSVGVWTWGVGVTNASGHNVDRYKDNPQSIERCLEVYVWLLREKYLPDVLDAFAGFALPEPKLAAALSFHYNTGAIKRASWVKSFIAGDVSRARTEFMNWRSPPEIIPRREKERDLFFDGRWSGDGRSLVYPVRKPSYTPDWSRALRVDVRNALKTALGQ